MCEYCQENEQCIHGKIIKTEELKATAGFNEKFYNECMKSCYRPEVFNKLELFILKGKRDKKAGLMLNTISGARYIDINYCPMCGRKLEKE